MCIRDRNDTYAGSPAFLMFSTISGTGRFEIYPSAPSSCIFSYIGSLPSLSGILATLTFTPTYSTLTQDLFPACPMDRTTSGFISSIFSAIF